MAEAALAVCAGDTGQVERRRGRTVEDIGNLAQPVPQTGHGQDGCRLLLSGGKRALCQHRGGTSCQGFCDEVPAIPSSARAGQEEISGLHLAAVQGEASDSHFRQICRLGKQL